MHLAWAHFGSKAWLVEPFPLSTTLYLLLKNHPLCPRISASKNDRRRNKNFFFAPPLFLCPGPGPILFPNYELGALTYTTTTAPLSPRAFLSCCPGGAVPTGDRQARSISLAKQTHSLMLLYVCANPLICAKTHKSAPTALLSSSVNDCLPSHTYARHVRASFFLARRPVPSVLANHTSHLLVFCLTSHLPCLPPTAHLL